MSKETQRERPSPAGQEREEEERREISILPEMRIHSWRKDSLSREREEMVVRDALLKKEKNLCVCSTSYLLQAITGSTHRVPQLTN